MNRNEWLKHSSWGNYSFLSGIPCRFLSYDSANSVSPWTTSDALSFKGTTKYYQLGSQRVAVLQNDQISYLHADHLGTASLTTCGENCPNAAAAGAVLAQLRHHPYAARMNAGQRARPKPTLTLPASAKRVLVCWIIMPAIMIPC